MCKHQTLYFEDRVGFVAHCGQCNVFQVGFGNLLINLCREDFVAFHQGVECRRRYESSCRKNHIKSVIIPTPCEGMNLYLSANELHELHNMLEKADAEWQSLQLLSLFNN